MDSLRAYLWQTDKEYGISQDFYNAQQKYFKKIFCHYARF